MAIQCGFSETQFSFCFTFEYMRSNLPAIPFPLFPNTVVEGRDGGGFDVKVGENIFFQFKIPKRGNSVSNSQRKFRNVFNGDWYEVKIDTNSNQFRLLKELANNSMNEVYYAMPNFHMLCKMRKYYAEGLVERNSSIFNLRDLPPYLSGYHKLIYHENYTNATIFSEPYKLMRVEAARRFYSPRSDFREGAKSMIDNAYDIYSAISRAVGDRGNILLDSSVDDLNIVNYVKSVLLTLFDIHWYTVMTE